MRSTATALKLLLGSAASGGALLVAAALGGGHEVAGATPWFLAGLFAASLLHVPAHVVMDLINTVANDAERRLEYMTQSDRPAMNEAVQRASRKSAMRGVKISAKRYYRTARQDRHEHDLREDKLLHDALLRWVDEEIAVTRRQDRPLNGGWSQPGLGLLAVAHTPSVDDASDPQIRAAEASAWAELEAAMALRGVVVPKAFKDFFLGSHNCGLGWRRAGHLLFMAELKRDHDAFVGFLVETICRIDETQKRRSGFWSSRTPKPPFGAGASSPGQDQPSRPWPLWPWPHR